MKIILTDQINILPVNEIKEAGYDEFKFVQVGGGRILKLIKGISKSLVKWDGNKEVCAIVGSRALCRAALSYNMPNLKFIQLTSTGYDDIDIDLIKSKDIMVSNARGIYDATISEYVLYVMLAYCKRYHKKMSNRRKKPLRGYNQISELEGKTVGIMGVGNVGTAIAQRLAGFNVTIIGYAEHTKHKEEFSEIYRGKDNLGTFLSRCDFVVNTLPHDLQTKGLLNATTFSSMRDTVTFINVGRSSIYDVAALKGFFKSHKDAICILDEFEILPNPFSFLHRLGNIYITPRIAAISPESDERLRSFLGQNLTAFLKGKDPSFLL